MRRRKVLYGIAASLPFLSGCLGGSENNTTEQPTTTQMSPTQMSPTTSTAEPTPTGTATQSGTGSIDVSQLKTYSNSAHGYSIRYPSGWTVDEKDSSYVTIEDPPTAGYEGLMTVSVSRISDGTSLDASNKKFIQSIKDAYDSFKVTNQQSFTLKSGQPAKIVDIKLALSKKGTIHGTFCLAIVDGMKYKVQLLIPNQNYATEKQAATAIIESFTIK